MNKPIPAQTTNPQHNTPWVAIISSAPLINLALGTFLYPLAAILALNLIQPRTDDGMLLTIIIPSLITMPLLFLLPVIMDKRSLQQTNHESPHLAWGILLPPVYLYQRAKLNNQPRTYLFAWAASLTLNLLISAII